MTMFRPSHFSIRWKLTLMAMATTAVALVLTVAGIAAFEYATLRRALHDQQRMMCEMAGGNSTAAIAFNRADEATSVLANLSADADVRAACIYDGDGKLLAKYAAANEVEPQFPASPPPAGSHFGNGALETSMPILMDGKAIGTIYMRSDQRELRSRLALFAGISPLILLAAFLVGYLIIRQLQRAVSVPLVTLAETSRRISTDGDYSLRAPQLGRDELGQLAEAFNHMLDGIRERDQQIQTHLEEVKAARDSLETRVRERTQDLQRANEDLQAEMEHRQEAERKREQMQANLVEASRRAGMADVATGVLHNVGNVLNSINVSTQIVQDAIKASRVKTFAKAADLIEEHAGDLPQFLSADERGRNLPPFLFKLSRTLLDENSQMLKEIDGLASNVAHIREIVSMQQSLSRISGVDSKCTLGEMIEDALKINQAGLQRHMVALERDFDPSFPVTIDRHKVLQILINLISNAKYAVNGTKEPVRRVILRARASEGKLRIEIIDNGVGIEVEQMKRLFAFGYTTRKGGHGFGLHSSALAARELGGSLEARSAGPGSGATFTLTVPVAKEAVHAA
jgi:two-component system, NtrC family, sensor kinase